MAPRQRRNSSISSPLLAGILAKPIITHPKTKQNIMKLPANTSTLFTSSLLIAACHAMVLGGHDPHGDNPDQAAPPIPIQPVSGANISLAADEGCTISTWDGFNCDGNELKSWLFTPSGTRSCEYLGEAVTMKLDGNCPTGHFDFYIDDSCRTYIGAQPLRGSSCLGVPQSEGPGSFKPTFGS